MKPTAWYDPSNGVVSTDQEPVAWPCLIDSADFSANTITLVMQCNDYKVSAGTHYLSTTPPQRTEQEHPVYSPFISCELWRLSK